MKVLSIHNFNTYVESKPAENSQADVGQILEERHPDWVRLSSPYRPVEQVHTLRHIHLSSWITKLY